MTDDRLNTLTHAFGLAVSIGAALAVLCCWSNPACLVYLASLVTVYFFSATSHGVSPGRMKRTLQQWDKGTIFFLIAGTYTPLLLANSFGVPTYTLILQIWAIAFVGFIAKVIYGYKGLWPYVVLGWGPILVSPASLITAPWEMIGLVVAGGLAYTVGLFFYLNDHRRGFHPLWHCWVLLGSALHFAAIARVC